MTAKGAIGKLLYGMFFLILAYLAAQNWGAFNAYIMSFSSFTQSETALLQGRPMTGLKPSYQA
jgi:hypothetical protein